MASAGGARPVSAGSSNEDEVELVAAEIARYLTRQPQAADSAEGIRRWWLAPRIGERQPVLVRAALARLEARGIVERRPLSDGTTLWGAVPPGAARH
jgi:hypothetical protein